MSTSLMPSPRQRFYTNEGIPAADCLLYTYAAGTNTPQAAFTDRAGLFPHTNPIVLDAKGEALIYFSPLAYKIDLRTPVGVQITGYPVDNTEPPLLTSTLSANSGAGIVGFLYGGNYGVGSLGRWLQDLSTSAGASLLGFVQAGLGASGRTIQSRLREEVHATDFMTQAMRDDIAADGATIDITDAIQAAIDSRTAGMTVMLPIGTGLITKTIFLRRNKVRIKGQGPGVSKLKFVNAAGGIVFTGDTDKNLSLKVYSSCALEDFEVLSSGVAANDASIVVDLTSFSYGTFDIEAQTRRAGAAVYFGQGNSGASPYYNRIASTGLFGGSDYTQDAFRFHPGAWAGGSNGPNANMIGPITRAAGLNTIVDLRSGLQNMFSNINGESIGGAYFLLGGNAAVQTGTSSGANGQVSLKDTTKAWVPNAYVGGAVQITGGTGAGQIRTIGSHSATVLTLNEPWGTIPDATSAYSIFEGKCHGNKFTNIRGEGLASLDPDFIYAYPGVDLTEFSNVDVSSLGLGKYLVDLTGSVRNSFYAGAKVTFTHNFISPGSGANVNAYPRESLFGGVKPGGLYVIEWVKVAPQYFTNGAAMTITLDVGGTAVGGGVQTLAVGIPDGNDVGMALPASTQKLTRSGTNDSVFLNLKTAAGFSATNSVNVTWCVTLL